MLTLFRLVSFTVLITVHLVSSLKAADWPQFRGHNSTGIAQEDQPLPESFSDTENVL